MHGIALTSLSILVLCSGRRSQRDTKPADARSCTWRRPSIYERHGPAGGSQSTSMNHEVSCDTHFRLQQQAPTPAKGAPETPQVVWEVNEWESASDYSKPSPVCPERPASQHAAPIQEEPSPKKQAVLLPWDLM